MKKNKSYKEGWTDGFACGYICSVVNQIRDHGMRTEVIDNWKANSMSIEKMEEHGVDPDDIEVINQNWKELNNIYP